MKKVLIISFGIGSLMLSGCGFNSTKTKVETSVGTVNVDKGQMQINAQEGNINVNSGGINIKTNDGNVSLGETGINVKTDNVSLTGSSTSQSLSGIDNGMVDSSARIETQEDKSKSVKGDIQLNAGDVKINVGDDGTVTLGE